MKALRLTAAAVLVAAVLPAAAAAATPIEDGATRWWRLSGGSMAEENGLPVTRNGTPGAVQPAGVAGDAGGAGAFNGSVDASFASQPTSGGSYTWEAWLRPAAGGYQRYVISTGSTNTGYHLYLASNNTVGFAMGTGAGQVAVSSDPVAIGDWHHVVAAVSPGQLRLVVDGKESVRTMGTMAPGTAVVRISRWAASATRRWYGALDEIAFYPLAMTTAKARERYAAGIGPAPRAWFSSPPAVTGSAVAATVAADPDTRTSCRLDGGNWSDCAPGAWSARGMADGDHAVEVRARDRWGRYQEPPESAAFRVDTTPPEVLLMSASAAGAFGARAFSEPGARIECRVDSGGWSACPDGRVPLSGLPDGSHRVSARATDAAGNVDPSPPVLAVSVDRSETFSPALVPELQARASRWRAVSCRVGDGTWGPCSGLPAASNAFGAAFAARTGSTSGEMVIEPPVSPLELGAIQLRNFLPVGRAARPVRGPTTRGIVRLLVSRPGTVHFAVTRPGSGKPVQSWQWKLPAGGTGRELPAGVAPRLSGGRYLLTAKTAGASASVGFYGAPAGGGRRGRLGGSLVRGTGAGDLFRTGGGPDTIYTGAGDDAVFSGPGPDKVFTGPGNDSVDGGSAGDLVRGGAGDDIVNGYYGLDTFYGEEGDDSLDGGYARDTIYGGPGDDVIHGGSATDRLDGGPGNDSIFPDSSADVITAGEGNDVVFANTGSGGGGKIDCGPGRDTIFVNRAGRDANGQGLPGGAISRRMLQDGSITGCERVIWADPLPVDPAFGIQFISPDDGASYTGTDKNDKLLGMHGPDTFYGKGGDDIVWADQMAIAGGLDSVDHLHGGAGDDTIYGGYGITFSSGDEGNDFIQGGSGRRNRIDGGPGNDVIRLRGDNKGTAKVDGGPGDDWITTFTHGRATIRCGPGRDNVRASADDRVARDCERVSRRR